MKWHQALLKTCHWFWWFFAQSPFDPSFSIFLTWLYINTSVPLHTAVSSPYIHITIISYNYVIVISYRLITISSQKPLWSPGDHPPPSPPASSCQRAVSVRHRAGLNWIFDFSCSNIGFLIKYWILVDQILKFCWSNIEILLIKYYIFYRTQIYLGSDQWVRVSETDSHTFLKPYWVDSAWWRYRLYTNW